MINFYEAVSQIKARLGISDGKAESMLRQACASGEIRSQKEPYTVMDGWQAVSAGPPEVIEPREWREHEIDMSRVGVVRGWSLPSPPHLEKPRKVKKSPHQNPRNGDDMLKLSMTKGLHRPLSPQVKVIENTFFDFPPRPLAEMIEPLWS
jgi:hypothetical protein